MKHTLFHLIPENLNYRRGFARLYATTATLWVLANGYDTVIKLLATPHRLSEVMAAKPWSQIVAEGLARTFIPPFVVYCFGISAAWIATGFKRD